MRMEARSFKKPSCDCQQNDYSTKAVHASKINLLVRFSSTLTNNIIMWCGKEKRNKSKCLRDRCILRQEAKGCVLNFFWVSFVTYIDVSLVDDSFLSQLTRKTYIN